jgi:predicted RNA-binding Zn-ribbon protein involved in translation (DUF1610 family)
MTEECPKCKSVNISKTEDVQGVEVEYNLENNEWVEANQNWYGETSVKYECNECGHEWE